MLRVADLFCSIQGEGLHTGTPSAFLRTTGCNLRCWFCDTPYTSWQPEGRQWTRAEVLEKLLAYDVKHVVITGGEPLLQPDVVPLVAELRQSGRVVTVETAGTVFRPVQSDLLSISPKLGNSDPSPARSPRWAERHARLRFQREIVQKLLELGPYQLKFVVDQPEDLEEIQSVLEGPPSWPRENVWIMPQGVTTAELHARQLWLEPATRVRGFRWSPRVHIDLFGNVRAT